MRGEWETFHCRQGMAASSRVKANIFVVKSKQANAKKSLQGKRSKVHVKKGRGR